MVTVLVQNKIDLIDETVVMAEEVEELAKRLKLKKVFRTSVKENFNVDQGEQSKVYFLSFLHSLSFSEPRNSHKICMGVTQ